MAYTISSVQVLPSVVIAATETEVTGATQAATVRLPANQTPYSYTAGTGASQCSKFHVDYITLSATPTTLDLTSWATGIGDSSLANIKGCLIINNTTTSGYKVIVGGAASNPFPFCLNTAATTFDVDEGGFFLWGHQKADGETTSSANNIKLDPGANTVNVTLVVWGE